jgi:methionyl-tRNA formyltransferase
LSRVLLVAGYDRAWHSVLIAEMLRRAGHSPSLILIAYPMTASRIRTILRSRGKAAILNYLFHRKDKVSISCVREAVRKLGIDNPSLRSWARQYGVRVVTTVDLNSAAAIREVAALSPNVTAYTGGGILRQPFLEATNRCVFNAHSGPLPMIRGMNAMEWSVLLGEMPSVTLHLIDEGIDTGAVVEWRHVPLVQDEKFDALRERLILAGAQLMIKSILRAINGSIDTFQPLGQRQRQCFILAPALRELAELKLEDASRSQVNALKKGI